MVKAVKKKSSKQVLSIYLDADQLERMRKRQDEIGVTLAEQVRRAINLALDVWEGKK